MKKLFSYSYFIYFGLVFILFSVILAPFVFLLVNGNSKYFWAKKIKTFWARWMSASIGIKTKTTFLENLNSNNNYIICANHKSYLDIVLMYLVIDHDFAFLGKAELLKWPVLRFFFKRGIDIPVYRGSRTKAAKCIALAHQEIKRGRSVVIFPEGGWDNSETQMRKFKNGAFQLAIDTGCPILPVIFKNNYDLFTDLTDFSGNSKPGYANAVVHHPISTDQLSRKDLVTLKDKTFNVIQQELNSED